MKLPRSLCLRNGDTPLGDKHIRYPSTWPRPCDSKSSSNEVHKLFRPPRLPTPSIYLYSIYSHTPLPTNSPIHLLHHTFSPFPHPITPSITSMIYELRIYTTLPGRLPNLLARFQNHTLRIWERHGIKQVGFWTTYIGDHYGTELTYLRECVPIEPEARELRGTGRSFVCLLACCLASWRCERTLLCFEGSAAANSGCFERSACPESSVVCYPPSSSSSSSSTHLQSNQPSLTQHSSSSTMGVPSRARAEVERLLRGRGVDESEGREREGRADQRECEE